MRGTGQERKRRGASIAALTLVLAVGGIVALTTAGPSSVVPAASPTAAGTLYFTTYNPPTVDEVSFDYHLGRMTLSVPKLVARLPHADGVLFSPDGHLIVGGTHSGDVYAVNPQSGSFTSIPTGVDASMHLSVSPDGGTLYTSGEPGVLAAVPLSPIAPGHEIDIHGATSVITAMAFGPNGQVMYTRSPPYGRGSIGLLDLATGETTKVFSNILGAHGVIYDPWSRSYLVVGGDAVLQLSPNDPRQLESEVVLPGNTFDQAAVTARGQVFIASNLGNLVLIDYSKTGRVGNTSNTVIEEHLAKNLDDVAPLVGPGALKVATTAHLRRTVGAGAIAVSALLLLTSLGLWLQSDLKRRTSRSRERQLPRWDRRRRAPKGSF